MVERGDGRAEQPVPQSVGRVHMVGIGGAGLSAIARVLLEQGYAVSGSDAHTSQATRQLAALGATVYEGHAPAHLGAQDGPVEAVIVSSAVAADNPEVVEALRRGIPVYKRAEWLGHMMAGRRQRCVAVAGTHGKTTTTAMIALIARQAGLRPTFIVGGTLQQLGMNAEAGTGDVFIIEADEYDRMFLGLSPEIAVVTALEWDHPDCYATPDDMTDAFLQFVALVPGDGTLIACGDESGVRDLLARARSGGRLPGDVVTCGLQAHNDWRAVAMHANVHGGYDFDVVRAEGTLGAASLRVPGLHNVRNALEALAVADRLGVSWQQAKATLEGFAGVERRFETKGEASGVLVVDDYAHHPTEIRATLAAARVRCPGRPVWAVFQPHTYSRTRALLNDFAGAFADADHVVILDIFAAREADDGTIDSTQIVRRMAHPDARCISTLDEASEYLLSRLQPGALLITLGAGDGYRVGEMVLEGLARRAAGSPDPLSGSCPHGCEVDALAADLQARFGDRLRHGEPLARHLLLGVGGPADLWLAVNTLPELVETIGLARRHDCPLLVIGSGANLLASDAGVHGLVAQNRCEGVTFGPDDVLRVVAQSGVKLAGLARQVAARGLSGLEWAIGVPGTVGGALVNNAGAYGMSISDCLVRAEILTTSGVSEWQPVEWFQHGYRSSRLKGQPAGSADACFVLQAELHLRRKPPAEIEAQMAAFDSLRRGSQPGGASLGCMFKNPPGDIAGRLIEAAGLKGRQIGSARISEVHANFFINVGNARAADFMGLISLARHAVMARFGVELELEIQRVGEWSE